MPKTTPIRLAQYDARGNLIAIYESISTAAKAVDGAPGNISMVLNNEQRSSYGFFWRTATGKVPKKITVTSPIRQRRTIPVESPNSVPVSSYDGLGHLVKTYPSKSNAARSLGTHMSRIVRATRKPTFRAAGLYWRETIGTPPKRIEIPLNDYYVRIEARREEREAREKIERDLSAKRRKVVEIDQTGRPVREFATMVEAANCYGVSRQAIHLALRHPDKLKRVAGRRIRFAHPELQ